MAETEYISLTGPKGERIHRVTCKRLNHGLIPVTAHITPERAAQHVATLGAKAASCCKPTLPTSEASGPRSPVQGAPSSAEQHAQVNRASAQRKALRRWEDGGLEGQRPETPDYDALVAARAKVTGRAPATAPAATEPATETVQANGRRRVTDPAEQRTIISGLLKAGVKPSRVYAKLREQSIAASGTWVEPLLDELTGRRNQAS